MSTLDMFLAFGAIIGFLAVLAGFVVLAAALIAEAAEGWVRFRARRAVRRLLADTSVEVSAPCARERLTHRRGW